MNVERRTQFVPNSYVKHILAHRESKFALMQRVIWCALKSLLLGGVLFAANCKETSFVAAEHMIGKKIAGDARPQVKG